MKAEGLLLFNAFTFSHSVAVYSDFVGIVNNAVANGIGYNWLAYFAIKQGQYPFNKVGTKYLIDLEQMEKFLEQEAYRNMNANKPEHKTYSYGNFKGTS